MERRGFFGKALAAGVGLVALARGIKARAKGLPSDPGSSPAGASGPDLIALPAFNKDSSYTLDQAMLERKTSRDYDPDRTLSLDQVSRLIWAANGVNRPDGHRTTPSAVARYPVDVYAALPEGIYLYETKKHELVRVSSEDVRSKTPAVQPGLRRAAMTVLYVENKGKIPGGETGWADLEIGCMVQNLYLEAAALGLGSCVFALVKYDKVTELMGLKSNQVLRIAQAVGPLKK